MPESCLNCQSTVTGAYCSNCGQKNIDPGIRFKDVVADFFSYSFSIDGPVGRTVKLLVTNPGKLFREYIQGRRKSYYRPVQFFIITCFVYFAFGELIEYDALRGEFQQETPESMKEIMSKVGRTTRFMVKNMNNLIFLLVFALASSFKIFHRKQYRLAEWLAMSFYIVSVYVLFGLSDQIAFLIDAKVGAVRILFFLAYSSYAYASVMSPQTFKPLKLISGFLIAVFAFLLYWVFAFALSWFLSG